MSEGKNEVSDKVHGRRLYVLALGALGVVYGDIGTSPLYAFRECFAGRFGILPSYDNVIGILSLILWSLIIVVSLKYLLLVMRADNRGEGGILALMALVIGSTARRGRKRYVLIALGVFGAALLYGDGMITPAISILSAVEGLEVATSSFKPYVIPLAGGILVALFSFQRQGTRTVGSVFGPVTLLWFVCLSILGLVWIIRVPEVLRAVSPYPALLFFVRNGGIGFLVLGSVFLVVTGSEALYADMGHFGKRPIRLAWVALVFPALVLNYFGQGALLVSNSAAIANPFYLLAPSWGLYPLVALSTAATIIASQAVISGAFSLTSQAIQLGYCPRMDVRHKSPEEVGQIYVPGVNWALMFATVGLVVAFGSSGALAGAYGIAVTLTMITTSILAFVYVRQCCGWSLFPAIVLWVSFLIVDVAFLGANLFKLGHGGWFPILVAGCVYLFISTWRRGRAILARHFRRGALSFDQFLQELTNPQLVRVPGTAVYMNSNPEAVPRTMLHNIKHNKVLHERVIILTVVTEEIPRVAGADRLEIHELAPDIIRIIAHYGFMEVPNVPVVLKQAESQGIEYQPMNTTFVLGRETLVIRGREGMARWRGRLFAFMNRNAQRATSHYRIPPNRVIEIGVQVDL